MTDLELTERCATWLGWEIFPFPEGMTMIIGILCKDQSGAVFYFDPLAKDRWNDLWKVIERLPQGITLLINPQGNKFWVSDYMEEKGYDGKLSDLPRAIVTLVAEMEEGK
jgi:hypothetical protein